MLTFQEMIAVLTQYWAEQGCIVHQGYDLEVGAGTFNPATFLRCLGPEPYSAVYVEPSRRPQDGRYGENPNRVQHYHQMQVILKPSPPNIQELYLDSLRKIGLNLKEHDIRFVHDDWENPTIGAWGLGWEIWSDGMEITQFTYFQSVGGVPVKPVSGELTYGLERLAMYIQGVDSIFDLKWNDQVLYGDLYKRSEWEWSHYNFSQAEASMWLRHFEDFEAEAKRVVRKNLPIPAYDFVMKASHAFNILDARGLISVTERTGYIARIRNLAKELADSYIKSREEQLFPLLKKHYLLPEHNLSPYSPSCNPDEKKDFLLEIGSEELPATFVPLGLASLEKCMHKLLNDAGIAYEEMKLYGAPRRLTIYIKGLAGGTHPKSVEKRGPDLQAAFDAQGALTKAGEGFFKSVFLQPVSLKEIQAGRIPKLEIREIKGKSYLFAHVENPGIATRARLASELPKLILNLDFPKKMRWGIGDIEYARPIRWIVALYDKEVIPFAIGGIYSGNETQGHRFLSGQSVVINHPLEYLSKLKEHHVMADPIERLESILAQISMIEKESGGVVVAREKVLPQVLNLVEWPFLTIASFDKSYLHAPKEVLISEMVEHQKYFPVTNLDGSLKPQFVVVCNVPPSDLIRAGNQRALSPRLADGVFLYEEDLKVPLQTWNEKLKNITFQKELGSMSAKVQRLIAFVEILFSHLPISDLKNAIRAASLCKADLASDLVGEFPELQGIAGKIYARHADEAEEVAQAIDEHWMPRGEKSPLPESDCGILVCLADKIDNLLSCYCLDLKPTSSSDPYGLRRQALGMMKILIERKYHLPIPKILDEAFDSFLKNPELSEKNVAAMAMKKSSVLSGIESFFIARLRSYFGELGFEKDEVEAVLVQGLESPFDLYQKIEAVHAFRQHSHSQFLATLEIYTRAKKILLSQNSDLIPAWQCDREGIIGSEKNRFPSVDPLFLKVEIEKKLFKKIEEVKLQFQRSLMDCKAADGKNYSEALSLLSELQEPVNSLFDQVKIIDEDLSVRQNRLSLLQGVWDLCEEVIDFSKIQVHEP